jgi:hypothetical protein
MLGEGHAMTSIILSLWLAGGAAGWYMLESAIRREPPPNASQDLKDCYFKAIDDWDRKKCLEKYK